jgi:hypothetical protein
VQLLASYTKADDQDKAGCEIELKRCYFLHLSDDLLGAMILSSMYTRMASLGVIFLEAVSGVSSQDIDGLSLIVFFYFILFIYLVVLRYSVLFFLFFF